MSKNLAILIGRLGKDPETINSATKFSLATSKKYTNKSGEKIEDTQWHQIVAFGKTGETLQKFLKKGDQVYIEGEIQYREHEGKWYTSILANSFAFIGGKSENDNSVNANDSDYNENVPEDDSDDLLF